MRDVSTCETVPPGKETLIGDRKMNLFTILIRKIGIDFVEWGTDGIEEIGLRWFLCS